MCCSERFERRSSLHVARRGVKHLFLSASGWSYCTQVGPVSFVVVAAGLLGYLRVRQGQYVPFLYEMRHLKGKILQWLHVGLSQASFLTTKFISFFFPVNNTKPQQDMQTVECEADDVEKEDEDDFTVSVLPSELQQERLSPILESPLETESCSRSATPVMLPADQVGRKRIEQGQEDQEDPSLEEPVVTKSKLQYFVERIPGLSSTWTLVSAKECEPSPSWSSAISHSDHRPQEQSQQHDLEYDGTTFIVEEELEEEIDLDDDEVAGNENANARPQSETEKSAEKTGDGKSRFQSIKTWLTGSPMRDTTNLANN